MDPSAVEARGKQTPTQPWTVGDDLPGMLQPIDPATGSVACTASVVRPIPQRRARAAPAAGSLGTTFLESFLHLARHTTPTPDGDEQLQEILQALAYEKALQLQLYAEQHRSSGEIYAAYVALMQQMAREARALTSAKYGECTSADAVALLEGGRDDGYDDVHDGLCGLSAPTPTRRRRSSTICCLPRCASRATGLRR